MGWEYQRIAGQLVYQCQELNQAGLTQAVSTSESGNQALHTGDLPDLVRRRRFELMQALNLKQQSLVVAEQVHGVNIQLVDESMAGRGANELLDQLPATDAMITREPGIVLSVLTADCLPIFIYDPLTPAVGMIHAGWRGSLNRIAPLTISKMSQFFGTIPGECWAVLGPAICGECYQVSPELATEFGAMVPEAVISGDSIFKLDLKLFNTRLLLAAGLNKARIIVADACTCCQPKVYFSYRGQAGTIGRMMSVISLNNST